MPRVSFLQPTENPLSHSVVVSYLWYIWRKLWPELFPKDEHETIATLNSHFIVFLPLPKADIERLLLILFSSLILRNGVLSPHLKLFSLPNERRQVSGQKLNPLWSEVIPL